MKKFYSTYKARQINRNRTRYELKRRSVNWKKRKISNKKRANHELEQQRQIAKPFAKSFEKQFIDHSAPLNFSFINNTNEVLDYFIDAEKLFRKKNKINLDISEIENITPDAIALLVASVNDKDFHHKSEYIGNAPKKPDLNKLFTQSGFYNFVSSRGFNRGVVGNLLHREMHHKVKPQIAQQAALNGIKHTFGNEKPYEPLYDILIECMSNTNNHASLTNNEKCNWWLYVYNDPIAKTTSYSFVDLGVGIFKSIIVQNYVKQIFKGSILYRNINLVDDLLSGKIQSRIEEDNEIRGKGIPFIVAHSKLDTFKCFYIITNDVKINIKTGDKEQLNHNFNGTFLYWELQPY